VDKVRKAYGDLLYRERNSRLLTQDAVAKMLNISTETYRTYELGVNFPRFYMAMQIWSILKVTFKDVEMEVKRRERES
jgi:DNA-binding XRE family transcriptional regulator